MTNFHFQHCLLGKHIVIEIDQCNDKERLKNMHHQLFCLGMVLKLFGRNFDSPVHVDGYHRPLGGDDEGGWKHEKSLIRFFSEDGAGLSTKAAFTVSDRL